MPARTSSSVALLVLSSAAAAQARVADTAPQPHPGGLRIAAWFEEGQRLTEPDATLRVRARDLDGDPIDVRLLNPPPGLPFAPVLGAPSKVDLTVDWLVPGSWAGRHELLFEVSDGSSAERARLVVDIERPYDTNSLVAGDVTGDGRLDVVAVARGTVTRGTIHVWAGAETPAGTPTATLTFPSLQGPGSLHLVDMNRDGILDVVSFSGGGPPSMLLLWKGGAGLQGTVASHAQLFPADWTSTGNMLGALGQGLFFRDLNGDGLDEVVSHSDRSVYIWDGADELTGHVTPDAILTVSLPAPGVLGRVTGTPLLFGDVTGDGVLDVVIGTSEADVGGVTDTGAIFLWAGGPGLIGSVPETAVLSVPGAAERDRLADSIQPGIFSGILLHELTGDGVLDVLATAPEADLGANADQGALYLWSGGSLQGDEAPDATFTVPAGAAMDFLGLDGTYFEDVTGDGIRDVLVASHRVRVAGQANAGTLYVWAGGGVPSGSLAPSAVLEAPDGASAALGQSTERSLYLRDFDGDAVMDVLALCDTATFAGIFQAGAVYLWQGGAALAGTKKPTATLAVTGSRVGDKLGSLQGEDALFGDVTGDGRDDLVTGSHFADLGFTENVGRLFVFAGGSSAGTVPPRARLQLVAPTLDDHLGDLPPGVSTPGRRQALYLADVTGDGILDVVAAGLRVNRAGVEGAGVIGVWAGGPGLMGTETPTATLLGEGNPFDALGQLSGQCVRFADLDGDRALDIVSGTASVDRGGLFSVGALYVWYGGAALTGDIAPAAILQVASPSPFDQLGFSDGESIRLSDVTGDGVLDVLGSSFLVDRGEVQDVGAIYFWDAALLCPGACALPLSMVVPGAAQGALLTAF